MNRKNQLLSLVLIVQIAIGTAVFWPQSMPTGEAAPLFPGVEIEDIVSLRIEEQVPSGENKVVELAKPAADWHLPNADDFPADGFQIDTILEKVIALTTDRLVARSEMSHAQLKVADDAFMRRIDFEVADGARHTLFVGTSPNPRATHVRSGDGDQVYLTGELTAFDLNGDVTALIDSVYLRVDRAAMAAIAIEQGEQALDFVKVGDAWTLADMGEGDLLKPSSVDPIINALSSLRMTEPLGQEAKPDYGMDRPTAIVTILSKAQASGEATEDGPVEEQLYTLLIGAKDEASDSYVVKSSTSPYYVRVGSFSLNALLDKERTTFLEPTPTPAPLLTVEPEATPTVAEDG